MSEIRPAAPHSLGEFRIASVLGEGGSGIVYDAAWGPRRVALKVLHPSLIGTERSRSQFLVEAQRLQAIAHPHVVKVLSAGQLPDGRPYLAMERLEGKTLAEVLASGPLPVGKALLLFEELCHAIGALHEQGLIHRDLKPENVFIVTGQGEPGRAEATEHAVLLDFGIAKELAAPASTTTMDGGIRGTPAYMAPERFFGQPAAVATDIYELAVTLYAMLAGQLPWEELADPEARLNPRPLIEVAEVPAELDIEVRRALSTRAQNRPPSAKSFLESVRQAAGSPPIVAPAPSETARMPPASRGEIKPTQTAQRAPWFAERKTTTERGKTPLAWAPTEAAPSADPPTRRPRWPWVAGALGIAAIAAGLAWWRFEREKSAATHAPAADAAEATGDAGFAADDPWNGGGPPSPPLRASVSIPTTSEAPGPVRARAEIAASVAHVPADTRVLVTVHIAELRANEQYRRLLGKIAANPRVAELTGAVPCLSSIVEGTEWLVYAASGFVTGEQGTLIMRGRWNRADVEACFDEQFERLKMKDGRTMLRIQRLGWVDFIDDHTVYLSVREDLAAAQVHELVRAGRGPTPRTRSLLAGLPDNRTVALVVDADRTQPWPQDYLPKGSDAAAWIRIDPDGTMLDLSVETRAEADARALEAKIKPELDELFSGVNPKLVGALDIRHTGATFTIRGKLTTLMIGLIEGALP